MIDPKTELMRILEFYHYQLDNDNCKMGDIESLKKILMENMELSGTVEEFAQFYGTTESNVRNIINRKMVQKPKRRVYYPFHAFTKIVPTSLLKKK